VQRASPVLQELIRECKERYLTVNNRASDDAKRQFREDLLKLVDSMVRGNGGSCYTNDMFEAVESVMKEEEQEILATVEEERRLERDAFEKAQSELLLKEREELEKRAEEERKKLMKEIDEVKLQRDLMVRELRQEEERKTRTMKEEQERKMEQLQVEARQQLQKELELKARLENEIDEKRQVYEEELRAARERTEVLRSQRERDLAQVQIENQSEMENVRRRAEEMRRAKEEQIQKLEEKAKMENQKLCVEDEQLAWAVHKICEKEYEDYVEKIQLEARLRARREAAEGKSFFRKILDILLK